jgi:protein SCO1/2
MTRVVALFAVAAVLLGVAAGGFLALRDPGGDPFADCREGTVAEGTAAIGGPFTLTGGDGARVTSEEVITGPTLIYFGYSFCPDVCPTDLARNAVAAELLDERGVDAGQVFITIDPERDTPEVAAAFGREIDPGIVGLSGSPEDVEAAVSAYRVYARKASDDPEFYLMDHSTFTYLAAPGHPFLDFFATDTPAEEVADRVACFAAAL